MPSSSSSESPPVCCGWQLGCGRKEGGNFGSKHFFSSLALWLAPLSLLDGRLLHPYSIQGTIAKQASYTTCKAAAAENETVLEVIPQQKHTHIGKSAPYSLTILGSRDSREWPFRYGKGTPTATEITGLWLLYYVHFTAHSSVAFFSLSLFSFHRGLRRDGGTEGKVPQSWIEAQPGLSIQEQHRTAKRRLLVRGRGRAAVEKVPLERGNWIGVCMLREASCLARVHRWH